MTPSTSTSQRIDEVENGQAPISSREDDAIGQKCAADGACPHAGRVGSNEFEIEQLEMAESVSFTL